ncbi:MAG TPA: FG-GAP-like repeat-containing protein, partial [Candidatus Polarisedimenticolaceae bacterium]|nr:FG-GAP-like repeat-containing protein [Candidatus Polarisedimenticolaceae bacterium]
MLHRRRLLGVALLTLPWVSVSGTTGSQRPLGTAIADFDGDGRDDLAVLRPGRLELLLVDPGRGAFRPAPRTVSLGFRADLLGAADFDGDGLTDLVVGERGRATLTTLRGDGRGGFGSPQVTLLPGELTALVAADVNRRDGLSDWLVGVVDAQGPALLVFEGLAGALTASPERIGLPAPATALAAGRFGGTYLGDVAAACGQEIVLIGGRDRKLHTPGAAVADPVLHSWPLLEEASALRALDGERALGILDGRGGARVLRDGVLVEASSPLGADGFDDRVTFGEDGAVTMTPSAVTATFVVNSTADTVDAVPGDGLCADGTGACTLRAALQEANALAGADEITFSLGTGTPSIAPASALPLVTGPVAIRGNTGGATRVELNGIGAGFLTNGFYFSAGSSGSLVRSFVINRFSGWAIRLGSANNTVEDCWIGLDAAGSTTVNGNSTGGVDIFGTPATGNMVGGSAAGTRNVISRSSGPGVRIESDASGNFVRGNYIGLNPGANVAAPNGQDGVSVLSAGAGNRIEKNVISGNAGNGISLEGASTTGTLIEGNLIGTHGSGLSSITNGQNGILITSASSSNTIGGTTAAQRNVISGNANAGGDGIELQGAGVGFTGTNIFGNYVGLDASGTAALSNGQDGILISGGVTGTAVGAATDTPGSNGGNVIGGNGRHGIRVEGTGTGTSIQGNLIGLRAGGTVAQANVSSGISITAPSTTVGGTVATQRNVIAGGNGVGVGVGGNNAVVQSNFIGTDITGTVKVGGGSVGAADPGSTGITGFVVGGPTSAPGVPPGNVIAPTTVGVSLLGSSVQGALVQGNLIGLNASGVAFGGTGNGVSINFGAKNNTIGGTTASVRNVISGNGNGVSLSDSGTQGNLVQGNYIGTDATGMTAVPNITGVAIGNGVANNTVGGSSATPGVAPGNVISGN